MKIYGKIKMRVIKLPNMSKNEIDKALRDNHICRIAFFDGDYPYISPFQYVYLKSTLYFHFTDYGKKMEIIKENRNVCVSIESFEANLNKYYFISLQGELVLIQYVNLKNEVLRKMVENAKEQFSENFLTAHGFRKEQGWEAFELKNQLVYKLVQKREVIGLKSL